MEARQLSEHCDPADEEREIDELTQRFAHRARFFAFRVERRFGLDPQWRDDLISSGYWGLLKALRNRRGDAHDRELSAYVSRRVEGAVIDEARRVLTRLSSQVDCDPMDLESETGATSTDFDWDHGSVSPDPERVADFAGRWRSIEEAIGHLSEDHRALLWSYAEGHSISEIAKREGCTTGRVQNQMTRIGRQIRAHAPELRRLLRHEI